jgi:hypothetical protein
MTHTDAALFQRMQELGYSHGCCTVTLQIVSQSKDVAREMLLYATDGRPREKRFIEKLGQVCSEYGVETV